MIPRRLGILLRNMLVVMLLFTWMGVFGLQSGVASVPSVPVSQVATQMATPMATLPSVSTGLVTMDVSADPAQIPLDQLLTVNIRLSGDSSKCGQSAVIKPVDVYLVLDHSLSMEGEKMEQAKSASSLFVDQMDFAVDRVGIVQFAGSADLLQSLTNNLDDIKKSISSITLDEYTNVAAGLAEAYDALKAERRKHAVPVIIVLSDGQSDVSSITHVSETAKADGMVVVAVGLGSDVDEVAMKSMASFNTKNQPLYYFAPEPSKLKDIYQQIALAIRQYGLAKDIALRFQADIYKFQILPDSLSPVGTVAGDTITWQQEILDNGETTFSFQVRARNAGDYSVGQIIEAKFLECEQNEKSLEMQAAPLVKITQVSDPPTVPLICDWWQVFPWWVLTPLALLLLVVLFLIAPPGKALLRKISSKPIWCKLLAFLFVLTLLVFSAMLAKALIGELCTSNELYYWKLTTVGDVGIYQTKFDGKDSIPVQALNQGSNCVACHEVSSNKLVAGVRNEQNGDVTVIQHNGNGIPMPAVKASYVAWSPDGKWMALSYEDLDIYILEVKTGKLTPLPGASDPSMVETMPAWSPDGGTIAFVRTHQTAPPPDTAEIDEPCDIYTVPFIDNSIAIPTVSVVDEQVSNQELRALPLPGASGDGFYYYPAYSPDGKWLAFTHHKDGQDTYADDAADIYIIPAMGAQQPVRLKINSEYADSWSSWSPDSKWLGFGSNRRGGQFDILVSPIGDNGLPYEMQYDDQGNRSAVFKVASASLDSDEEFHPVWVGTDKTDITERVLALWPWLIPLILLPILMLLICPERKYTLRVEVVDGLTDQSIDNADVGFSQSNFGGRDE